jgi:hypothetical protein
MESQELIDALAGEVLLPRRELDDQVVDGPQLVDGSLVHDASSALVQPVTLRSHVDLGQLAAGAAPLAVARTHGVSAAGELEGAAEVEPTPTSPSA